MDAWQYAVRPENVQATQLKATLEPTTPDRGDSLATPTNPKTIDSLSDDWRS
jgi:hypothetical protein